MGLSSWRYFFSGMQDEMLQIKEGGQVRMEKSPLWHPQIWVGKTKRDMQRTPVTFFPKTQVIKQLKN